jgi:hypothetical protein
MDKEPFSSLSPQHHLLAKVAIMMMIVVILAVAVFFGIAFQEKIQMSGNTSKQPSGTTNTASLKDWNRLRSTIPWYTNDTPTNTVMEPLPAPVIPATNSN